MPRRREWTSRLDVAVEELRSLPCPVVDRAAVEKLFGVSPRQALRILARMGAYRAGKGLQLGRDELVRRLEEMGRDETVVFESRRRERIAGLLEQVRRELAAKRVPIRGARDGVKGLPEGVSVRPGRLAIEYGTAEELLARLLELAQAIAVDYERFREQAE